MRFHGQKVFIANVDLNLIHFHESSFLLKVTQIDPFSRHVSCSTNYSWPISAWKWGAPSEVDFYCILYTNSSANAQLNMYNGHDYKAMEPPRTTKGIKTQAWRHEQIEAVTLTSLVSHGMQQLACFPTCLLSVLLKICCKHKSGEGRHIQQIYVHRTTENGGRAKQTASLVVTAIMSGRDGKWSNLQHLTRTAWNYLLWTL